MGSNPTPSAIPADAIWVCAIPCVLNVICSMVPLGAVFLRTVYIAGVHRFSEAKLWDCAPSPCAKFAVSTGFPGGLMFEFMS